MPSSLPAISWGAMLPMLVVTGTALLILVLDPFTPPARRDRLAVISLLGVVASAGAVVARWGQPEIVFGGMLAADAFVTYAFEAAAAEGADVGRLAAQLLTRTVV